MSVSCWPTTVRGPTFALPQFVSALKAFFAYLLVGLVLLRTFSRELLVVDFALNRATITARFCVNKARPQLHCDGKFYFAKRLKQQKDREAKVPNALKEKQEMLPSAFRALVLAVTVQWARAPAGHAAYRSAGPLARAPLGVFRPPHA